jgi:hypothetical protein
MSAPDRRRYVVKDKQGAQWIGSLVAGLDAGWTVTLAPPGRSLPQNRTFHDMCDDIAKARPVWNDMPMTAEDWKQLLVLSHAVATDGGGVRLTKDLEGSGLVQLRESTARMSKARATSLIDYVIAWATAQGIQITIPERQ